MNVPERPTQAETKPVAVNARRKLIRGAFALPAVAAVHSGSALAATSSLRCLTNGPAGNGTQGQLPGVINFGAATPGNIAYFRIELAVARQGTTENYLYYVDHDAVLVAANARRVTISSFSNSANPFRLFNLDGNEITGASQLNVAAGYTVQAIGNLTANNRPTAVLIFSPDGKQIVGVGKVQSNIAGHVATFSCWTSFGVPGL